MPTKIAACTCVHRYQDQRYGPGKRVFNSTTVKNGHWRCSICKRSLGKAD